MPLKINQTAPDFTLPSTLGTDFSLEKTMGGRPLLLYFYPKDFTPQCTLEACEFRDTFSFFDDLDIDIFGISRDNIETHQKFRTAHNLPFHLLSDEKGKVADLYKATAPFINFTRRITYLVNAQHKIVACYENLFGAKKHIIRMVTELKRGTHKINI